VSKQHAKTGYEGVAVKLNAFLTSKVEVGEWLDYGPPLARVPSVPQLWRLDENRCLQHGVADDV